jgi:ferredoxin-thioredoxin reductase catalytic subunit
MLRVAGLAQLQTKQTLGLDPPFCPCRMVVGTDDTAIDKVDVPIQLAIRIGLLL